MLVSVVIIYKFRVYSKQFNIRGWVVIITGEGSGLATEIFIEKYIDGCINGRTNLLLEFSNSADADIK